MKATTLIFLLVMPVLPSLAQAPADNSSAYPTKMERLLRRPATVITTSMLEVGGLDGKVFEAETNTLTVDIRTEVIGNPDSKAKEYGLALQMRHARDWRSRITYIDYDELDGLIAGLNKILSLQPELPVVQAKYETRGGLIIITYSTEKREVLARLALNNDDPNWIKMSLDSLKDFRDLIVTAKSNLDQLKTTK